MPSIVGLLAAVNGQDNVGGWILHAIIGNATGSFGLLLDLYGIIVGISKGQEPLGLFCLLQG